MNVIWIVADTLRRDHLGCYGGGAIKTPALNSLASKGMRFDRHYAAGFPTMPNRADSHTGRWSMSFMNWGPLATGATTLAQLLSERGVHTAACVDTPFFLRFDMNYDRGFQTFFSVQGQEGSATSLNTVRKGHESRDVRAAWRFEEDRNAPRTITKAMHWLERHYKEEFFLYIDTWDPHEPWDAPPYYTELYWPNYDGEVVAPVYGRWHEVPGLTEDHIRKAHATYCGEITMVDAWIGHLLRKIENMGLWENTVVIFTSDHGFYFGEHNGIFGKMVYGKKPDGTLYSRGEKGAIWDHSPLYEEVAALPLLVYVPGVGPGSYRGLTSVIDVMPTVLDAFRVPIPNWVEGRSLLPKIHHPSEKGREYVISSIPFANPGDNVNSVDNVGRKVGAPIVTTVTTQEWSFLFTETPGRSELYRLSQDPKQRNEVISSHGGVAREHHDMLMDFMRRTNVSGRLINPRSDLRL